MKRMRTRRHVYTAEERRKAAAKLLANLGTGMFKVPSGFINSVIRATRDATES